MLSTCCYAFRIADYMLRGKSSQSLFWGLSPQSTKLGGGGYSPPSSPVPTPMDKLINMCLRFLMVVTVHCFSLFQLSTPLFKSQEKKPFSLFSVYFSFQMCACLETSGIFVYVCPLCLFIM